MAKVIGPLHSSEARGRVGSLVYNTWRGISYVKAHVTPVQPGSALQLAQRARVAAANTAWKALSDAQRQLWHDYASKHPQIDWTGNPIRLSGHQLFMRIRVRQAFLSGTLVSVPPKEPLPYPLGNLLLTEAAGTITLFWTAPTQPLADTYRTVIYRAKTPSAGHNPTPDLWRYRTNVAYATISYMDAGLSAGLYRYWIYVNNNTRGGYSPMITNAKFSYGPV